MSHTCTFLTSHDEPCGRPRRVDYLEVDPLLGDRLIVSLCAKHDSDARRVYAAAMGYQRREAEPVKVLPFHPAGSAHA